MRRLAIALLATSLLAASTVSALAQASSPSPRSTSTPSPSPTREPSPSPAPTVVETGQRVEVEDVGLALTIPASWVVDDPANHPFDLAVKDLARLEECWLVVEAASLYAGETLADKAPAYAAELRRILDGETMPEWITLTLRSGSVVRLDTGSRWHDSFTYLWLQGEDLPALTCQGLDPGDQWLSIAESLELMAVVEPTPAPPAAAATAVASTPRPEPATVIEQAYEPVTVKVTERGSRPRRYLRYDWTEGQKETLGVDIRMHSETSLGIESSGHIEVPTLRMTVTIEVLEVFANGDYLVEQQLTELGVPMGEAGDMAEAREIEAVLASIIGLRVRARVNDRGVLLLSETHYPPGMEPAADDTLDPGLDAMAALIQPLPEQRVGIDAVWRVRQTVEADLGYEVTQFTRTKLNDAVDDEIRLRTAVRQEAPSQRIEVGSDAGYRLTLDAHELSTRGTALVGLRRLAPELDSITASHTKVTARQGQQIETAIVDLEIDLSIEPLESAQPDAD